MDQNVLITGVSRGLGLCLAQKFIAAGDTVYGVSRTDRAWKQIPAALIDSGRLILQKADLTEESQVKKWMAQVRKQAGRIDGVINNAGYGGRLDPVEKTSSAEFWKHFEQNLASAFYVCKHLLPVFRKQKKGWILNISSMAGTRAVPRLFAYSASKFGVLALSQAIAKENADWDLQCVTVCPGGMNTSMRSALFGTEDAAKQQSPEFVADVIYQVARHEIRVESGGHLVIRHGKITGIYPAPVA